MKEVFTSAELEDVGVEPVNRPKPEPVTPEKSFQELTLDYQLALLDMQDLQPRFYAAQKRYREAREALKDYVYDADNNLNKL